MFLAFFSFFAYDNNHSNLSEKTSARSKRIRICHNMKSHRQFKKSNTDGRNADGRKGRLRGASPD